MTSTPVWRSRSGVAVEEVGGAVEADGGFSGAGGALDAEGVVEVGADEGVLVGLDGGDDVAHGSDAGAFDFFGEDFAGEAEGFALVEAFLFVRAELSVVESEAAAADNSAGVGAG